MMAIVSPTVVDGVAPIDTPQSGSDRPDHTPIVRPDEPGLMAFFHLGSLERAASSLGWNPEFELRLLKEIAEKDPDGSVRIRALKEGHDRFREALILDGRIQITKGSVHDTPDGPQAKIEREEVRLLKSSGDRVAQFLQSRLPKETTNGTGQHQITASQSNPADLDPTDDDESIDTGGEGDIDEDGPPKGLPYIPS